MFPSQRTPLSRYLFVDFRESRPALTRDVIGTTAFWSTANGVTNQILAGNGTVFELQVSATNGVAAPTWDAVNGNGLTITMPGAGGVPTVRLSPQGLGGLGVGGSKYQPVIETFFVEWKFTILTSPAAATFCYIGAASVGSVGLSGYYSVFRIANGQTAVFDAASSITSMACTSVAVPCANSVPHTVRMEVNSAGVPSWEFDGALVERLASGAKGSFGSQASSFGFSLLMAPAMLWSGASNGCSVQIASVESGLIVTGKQ